MLHSATAYAQDIDLSQPFIAGQYLSPAAAGGGAYGKRLNGNLRTQFNDGTNLYRTILVGFDKKFNAADDRSKNYLGFGAQVLSDQLMSGALQVNFLSLNVAYHIYLDENLYKELSLGLGTVIAQTNFDKSKIRFGDQYASDGTYIGSSSLEVLNDLPMDVSATTGLLYTVHDENKFFQLGASSFLVTKPVITSSPYNEADQLKLRFYSNLEIPILNQATILLHANYVYIQDKSHYYGGGAIGLPLGDGRYKPQERLYLGCFYRSQNAIIPSFVYKTNKYTLGLSYDIYTNNNAGASIRPNSFELSFTNLIGRPKRKLFSSLFD
jgi:type IX secretion system PorP/SprF family membrane protein